MGEVELKDSEVRFRVAAEAHDWEAAQRELDAWKFPKDYKEYDDMTRRVKKMDSEWKALIADLGELLENNDVRALRAKLDAWQCPRISLQQRNGQCHPEYWPYIEKLH